MRGANHCVYIYIQPRTGGRHDDFPVCDALRCPYVVYIQVLNFLFVANTVPHSIFSPPLPYLKLPGSDDAYPPYGVFGWKNVNRDFNARIENAEIAQVFAQVHTWIPFPICSLYTCFKFRI